MRLIPRDPYQVEALRNMRQHYDAGKTRQLGHCFTGGGKTSGIACNIPKVFPKLIDYGLLFLSHRREILYQAYNTFKDGWPDKWLGLEMGDSHACGDEDFIFASVDSIGRVQPDLGGRISKFKHRKFGIIIADEGHHVTENGVWDNILTYFGVGSDNESHYAVGGDQSPLSILLTATPVRSDGVSLQPFVDTIAFTYDILYGIRNGWLVPIKAYRIDITDILGEQASSIERIIETWRRYADGFKTLAFAKDVNESKLFAGTLNEYAMTTAAHIDANTPLEERDELVGRFNDGDLTVLSNRLIFTEGYNNPSIECILDNAETERSALHIQKIGRGLRPSADTNIDAYSTKEERKEAIRTSDKPALVYVATFDPTTHDLDMQASLFGIPKSLKLEGQMLVEEVVEILEEIREKHPDRNVAHVESFDELKAEINRVDLWSKTIRGNDVQAITHLRWVSRSNDDYALWMNKSPFDVPTDPNTGRRMFEYKDSALIISLQREGLKWLRKRTYVGGWNKTLKRPLRRFELKMEPLFNVQKGIGRFDRWMEVKHPILYDDLVRADGSVPTNQMIKYMTTNGIKGRDRITTAEEAQLLIDDFRIQRALQ